MLKKIIVTTFFSAFTFASFSQNGQSTTTPVLGDMEIISDTVKNETKPVVADAVTPVQKNQEVNNNSGNSASEPKLQDSAPPKKED